MRIGTFLASALIGGLFLCPAAFAQTMGAPATGPASAPAPELETSRKPDPANGKADKPAGRLMLRRTASNGGAPPKEPPGIPEREVYPIGIEPDPDPDPELDPRKDWFDQSTAGKVVWVLDRSGSMGIPCGGMPLEDWNGFIATNPSRLMRMKIETINAIRTLHETDEFAIVSFGNNPEWVWFPSLVQATAANRQAAVQHVISLQANGWTPAYTALRLGCETYGSDLDKLFFLSDGSPNYDSGAPSGYGSASVILAAFPGWFAPLQANGCKLVCVHIGNDGGAAGFMQSLAAQNGGAFVHV